MPSRAVEVFIDGASLGNPGPSGVGVAFVRPDGTPIRQFAKGIGQATNNVAEYLAFLYALQEALQAGCTDLVVRTDSELLARQLSGRYKVRDATLRILHDLATHLQLAFASVHVEHVPRERNRLADRLAGDAALRQQTFASSA